MAYKRNKALAAARKLVADLKKKITISQAYLFGSQVQGSFSPWSDIDIALVSPKFKGSRFHDIKMLIPLLRNQPNCIEIHPFKKEDFDPKNNLFIKEIIDHGVKI